jgi:RHS repeat-associated protein
VYVGGVLDHYVAQVVQAQDYYAFGAAMEGRSFSISSYRFGFNGKENDPEFNGNYDFGARFLDVRLGRWLSTDPVTHSFQSPYTGFDNNPINLIDSIGTTTSPVYDEDGNFLGTDDEGLQGDAIVMRESDFKQGMSHKDALEKGTGTFNTDRNQTNSPFDNPYTAQQALDHYKGLRNRPDYDGVLTLSEANEWYKNGNGEPLYVDASKIDLSGAYKEDFKVGTAKPFNFESSGGNPNTGLVYGTIILTKINPDGVVKLGNLSTGKLDEYNFEMQSGRFFRNVATAIGGWYAGDGVKYDIYNYGTGTLKDKPRNSYLDYKSK